MSVIRISAIAEAIPSPIPGSASNPALALRVKDVAHALSQTGNRVGCTTIGVGAERLGALIDEQKPPPAATYLRFSRYRSERRAAMLKLMAFESLSRIFSACG
jgi:hypothetical protein